MIATSGFLTALECTKFVFGRGSAPDPAGGAYSAAPDPLADLRGPTSSGGLTIEAPEARASGPAPSGGPELDGVKILEPLFTSLAVCGSGMVCYTVFTLFLTSRLA